MAGFAEIWGTSCPQTACPQDRMVGFAVTVLLQGLHTLRLIDLRIFCMVTPRGAVCGLPIRRFSRSWKARTKICHVWNALVCGGKANSDYEFLSLFGQFRGCRRTFAMGFRCNPDPDFPMFGQELEGRLPRSAERTNFPCGLGWVSDATWNPILPVLGQEHPDRRRGRTSHRASDGFSMQPGLQIFPCC